MRRTRPIYDRLLWLFNEKALTAFPLGKRGEVLLAAAYKNTPV
jgi:hypothetical protein